MSAAGETLVWKLAPYRSGDKWLGLIGPNGSEFARIDYDDVNHEQVNRDATRAVAALNDWWGSAKTQGYVERSPTPVIGGREEIEHHGKGWSDWDCVCGSETCHVTRIGRLTREVTVLKAENARLEAERDEAQRAKYGTPCRCESWIETCGQLEDQVSALTTENARLREALRQIAEGNLGDYPWQADYERIREVARAALPQKGEK